MNKPGCVFCDIEGLELTASDRKRLSHPQCGGVILFARNYENVGQLRSLTREIKTLKPQELLISVDQEGGRVQRFREGFLDLPPLRSIGEQYDQSPQQAVQQSEKYGWLMAAECLSAGIDFSFAPVLDLDYGFSDVIGNRAFHSDHSVVIELAAAYIRGMHRAGMAAVGKHFPGHGFVAADSHTELPMDTRRFEEIEARDLQPFKTLVRAGLDGIMPAHVIYDDIDDVTAGFSEYWLKEVLRDQLRFRGLIFSDDLSMAGAASAGTPDERADMALHAGCDILLVCNDQDAADEVLNTLEDDASALSTGQYARMYGSSRFEWNQLHASNIWNETLAAVV